jgi:apolipoprotein D and lipocalin family protein
LRVSFFSPFYADYRILWIDRDYRHALVGGGDEDYLWILSRSKTVDGDVKKTILAEAELRGYDISRFVWVEQ